MSRASLSEPVAGNGLLHRRLFLMHGAAAGAALLTATAAPAAPLDVPASMKTPGVPPSEYGERSPHEAHVKRIPNGAPPSAGTGGPRPPLQSLEGVIPASPPHLQRHPN